MMEAKKFGKDPNDPCADKFGMYKLPQMKHEQTQI